MEITSGPLLSFQLYHRAMRSGAARLVAALDRTEDTSRLAPWYAHYRQACLIHAAGEDKVLWPALAGERPDLSSLFRTMEGEHEELNRVLADLGTALDDGRVDDARRSADRLEELVGRHLDGEEHDAVPALVDSLQEQLGELMRKVQQSAGPEGAAVAVPFFLEVATDEERDAVLAAVPPPVREGYETAWAGSYADLVTALEA